MNDDAQLLVAFCNRKAAKYAVEHWHYSRVLPAGNLFTVGAWERGRFIGCVIFSQGATRTLTASSRPANTGTSCRSTRA